MSTADAASAPPRAPARLIALLVLAVLPLVLRLAPIEHGLPRNYVPDTHAVRGALGMARDLDPVPPVGKYSTYPNLMPYMLVAVYAGQYGVGRVAGWWGGSAEYAERAVLEPQRVHLPARWLVALLGAATAWITYRAARAGGLARRPALVAGYWVATGLLHLQFSVQERPWVPTVFFGALAVWAALVYGRDQRPRALYLAGAASGLAFACHQVGIAFLLLCGFAWLFAPFRSGEPRQWLRRVRDGVIAVACCAFVGVAFGHAYYLRHGSIPDDALSGGAAAGEHFSIGGQAVRFEFSLESFQHLSRALAGYDPALLIAGGAGLVLALGNRALRPLALFTLVYAGFFMTNPSDHVRYLLPLTVLLALPGAVFLEGMFSRRALRPLALVLLAVPLVQALRFVWVLRVEDTRAEAERALLELQASSNGSALVAIDHYGPVVDLDLGSLERLAGWRELRLRESRRLEWLQSDPRALPPGIAALYVEELFGVDPDTDVYGVRPERADLGGSPGDVLARLGVTHFLLVNRRPSTLDAPFLAQLTDGWQRVWTIAPGRGADRGRAREAFLPTEMDFPLTALWSVVRAGPRLELYALP